MVKIFSTGRDTQGGSQSYMEKRRGCWEIEVTRRRTGGIKRGNSNLASNQFLIFSPQSGTHKEIHGVFREEKGREEIEVTWERKRRVKRG